MRGRPFDNSNSEFGLVKIYVSLICIEPMLVLFLSTIICTGLWKTARFLSVPECMPSINATAHDGLAVQKLFVVSFC